MAVKEDVSITIGANISPIQKAFAQVKSQAGEIGEKAGFEFGNRTAYMAERRVDEGMKGVLKSLATAKDPIEAISQAIEGLARSFRIAGAAFVGVGLGAYLFGELTKAAAGADLFYGKVNDIFSVASNSSKEFTDKAIKNFEDAKAAYGKEGFFEYLIYGAGERAALKSGEEAYQQALDHARSLREASYKADADAASENAAVKAEGEIEKINEKYAEEIARAQAAGDSIVEIERAKAEEIDKIHEESAQKEIDLQQKLKDAYQNDPGLTPGQQLENKKASAQQKVDDADAKVAVNNAKLADAQAAVEKAQSDADRDAKIAGDSKFRQALGPGGGALLDKSAADSAADLKAKQDALAAAQDEHTKDLTEHQNALNELKRVQIELDKQASDAQKKEADGLLRSKKEAADLQSELAEAGMTDEQKIEAQKKKIADEQAAAKRNAPSQTASQQQDAQNQITKDQIKLQGLEKSRADKVKEETERRDALVKELPAAQKKLAEDQVKGSVFHGAVTSLRREGFGKTPGGGSMHDALKTAQASEKHLADLNKQIAALNAKIGGAA